jgi:D-3-phosphoglycerate dehydrogenase
MEDDAQLLESQLPLSRTVGRIFASVVKGPLTALHVETQGRITDPEPFAIQAAMGYLMRTLRQRVEPDEARRVAAERGLVLTGAVVERPGSVRDEVTWTGSSKNDSWTLRGARNLRGVPIITEANGFCFELIPTGTLLFVRNEDVPGVVGRLGTFLGSLGINIEAMRLSKLPDDPLSFSVLRLAASLAPEQLADLRRVPHVADVRQADLTVRP